MADLFDFRGFTGVVSYEDGQITYAWGNEATTVADAIEDAVPVITGRVVDFTEGLSLDGYTVTVRTEQPVTADTMLANLAVAGGTVQITAADGVTAVTNVGTGTLVKVYDEAGVLCDVYTVVIYGDVNGDGVIDDLDFLRILKTVMGYSEQTGVYAISADINRNGMVDDIDFLRMLKYVMGYPNSNIVQ